MKLRNLTSKDVAGKKVIYRVDYNVPLKDGKILDNSRIALSVPTIRFLLDSGAKEIHILSHLGRPTGTYDPNFSMSLVLSEIEKLVKHPCEFRKFLKPSASRIQLHGNLRFSSGEMSNDTTFLKRLLQLGGEVYVNDAFSVCHRTYASIVGIPTYLPAFPGLLLRSEVSQLKPLRIPMQQSGLSVLLGGVRLESKTNIMSHYAQHADNLLIGGALANGFLEFNGHCIGKSISYKPYFASIEKIIETALKYKKNLLIPVDVLVTNKNNLTFKNINEITEKDSIVDIGPKTIALFKKVLSESKEIVWNGPMGKFEDKGCDKGTLEMMKIISAQKSCKTVIGGGDTLEALDRFGLGRNAFTHVSTGGVAMLEFLEGKDLPGIEVLSIA